MPWGNDTLVEAAPAAIKPPAWAANDELVQPVVTQPPVQAAPPQPFVETMSAVEGLASVIKMAEGVAAEGPSLMEPDKSADPNKTMTMEQHARWEQPALRADTRTQLQRASDYVSETVKAFPRGAKHFATSAARDIASWVSAPDKIDLAIQQARREGGGTSRVLAATMATGAEATPKTIKSGLLGQLDQERSELDVAKSDFEAQILRTGQKLEELAKDLGYAPDGLPEMGLDDVTATPNKKTLRKFSAAMQDILDRNPEWTPEQEDTALGLMMNPKALSGTLGQLLPYMAATTVAFLATGPAGSAVIAYAVEGSGAYADAIDRGASEQDAQTTAVIVGAGNALIEMAQIGQVVKFAKISGAAVVARDISRRARMKMLGGMLAKQAFQEGLEEALQNANEELTGKIIWNRDLTGFWDRTGTAAFIGSLAGVILGGAGGAARAAVNSMANRNAMTRFTEPEAAPVAQPPAQPKVTVAPGQVSSKVALAPGGFTGAVQAERATTEARPKPAEAAPQPAQAPIAAKPATDAAKVEKVAEKGVDAPKDPWTFQNTNQEKVIHSGWETGNNYRFILEGTGDIFREMAKDVGDGGYIYSKTKRALNHIEDEAAGMHSDDTAATAQKGNREKFKAMRAMWENQPATSEGQKLARDLNLAMIDSDFAEAKRLLTEIMARRGELVQKGKPAAPKPAPAAAVEAKPDKLAAEMTGPELKAEAKRRHIPLKGGKEVIRAKIEASNKGRNVHGGNSESDALIASIEAKAKKAQPAPAPKPATPPAKGKADVRPRTAQIAGWAEAGRKDGTQSATAGTDDGYFEPPHRPEGITRISGTMAEDRAAYIRAYRKAKTKATAALAKPAKEAGGIEGFATTPEGLGITEESPADIKAAFEEYKDAVSRRDMVQAKRLYKEIRQLIALELQERSQPAPKAEPQAEGKAESGPGGPTIVVQAEPTAEALKAKKSISTEEVVNVIAKSFAVPIRTGRFRGRAGGIFKPDVRIARLKRFGDIATAAHEAAHALWHDIKINKLFVGKNQMVRELRGLDYDYPMKARANEGFAEFVRHYLTTDQSAELAPEFHEWFTKWLPDSGYADAFTEARKAVDLWRQQGAVRRVGAQIDKERGRFKNIKNVLSPANLAGNWKSARNWFLSKWINRLQPLVDAQATITRNAKLEDIPAQYQFSTFAKVATMASASKARQMVLTGMIKVTGERTGPGLAEVLEPIADELRDPQVQTEFESYMYARHALDVLANDKNPGITAVDARQVVKEFGQRPGWKEAADGVTAWHDGLIDYLVDAGGMPAEAKVKMRKLYPHYVPLMRSMEAENAVGGIGSGGKRIANLPQAVKRLKGSGRRIISPLESSIVYAEKIVALSDKIRIGDMLANAAEKYGQMGEIIEAVPPSLVPASAPLSNIKRQLEDAGVDLSDADMDSAITIFQNLYQTDAKDNVIFLWRKGKRQLFQVAPDVYRALVAIDQQFELPTVFGWLAEKAARGVRLGATGLRAGFSLITNPLRDVQTAVVQTRTTGTKATLPSVVYRSGVGILDNIMGKEIARLFKAGGGEMAQPLAIDRRFTQEALHEILAVSPKAQALNWSKHPVDTVRQLFGVTELGPRLAEFEAILRAEGWKPGQEITFGQFIAAQAAAADVTVDFREGGSYAMFVNRATAFFNAQIQGNNRLLQAFRKRPVATALKALAWITLPAIGLWWLHKDEEWYKDLPSWEKARFYHVKLGDAIVRIPKPFEAGMLFGSLVVATLESWYSQDPKHFQEAMAETLDGLMPPIIPTIAEPVAEVVANKDFFRERPIVSRALEGQRPEDQYYANTTESARKVGKLFGVAPAKVEHLIEGYSAGLATDTIKAGESVLRAAGVLPKKGQSAPVLKDMPVIGRLFTRETTTRVFDDFYTRLAELNMDAASARAGKADGLNRKDSAIRARLGRTARLLSKIRKEMKAEFEADTPNKEKLRKTLSLHKRMKVLTVAAMKGDIRGLVSKPRNAAELQFAYSELYHAKAQAAMAGDKTDFAAAMTKLNVDAGGLIAEPAKARKASRGTVRGYYSGLMHESLKVGDVDAAAVYYKGRLALTLNTRESRAQKRDMAAWMKKNKVPAATQRKVWDTIAGH